MAWAGADLFIYLFIHTLQTENKQI